VIFIVKASQGCGKSHHDLPYGPESVDEQGHDAWAVVLIAL